MISGHCVTKHESGEDKEDWSGQVRDEDIKRAEKRNLDHILKTTSVCGNWLDFLRS